MRSYKARGIVLHTIKYGESGAIAYLLTDVWGRQSYMVQGVRSTRGHGNKGAMLQPMFLVEFEGLESPRAELHRFREMRLAEVLRTIPTDVRRSTMSLFMAEMLYRLVREQRPDPELFEFVWGAVLELDSLSSDCIANYHLWFMVGLACRLGYGPSGEWTHGCWFDIREGCFTPVRPAHGLHFSPENSLLLHYFMENDTPKIAMNRVRRVEFLNAMMSYFGYHLDAVRDVRSIDILREVF